MSIQCQMNRSWWLHELTRELPVMRCIKVTWLLKRGANIPRPACACLPVRHDVHLKTCKEFSIQRGSLSIVPGKCSSLQAEPHFHDNRHVISLPNMVQVQPRIGARNDFAPIIFSPRVHVEACNHVHVDGIQLARPLIAKRGWIYAVMDQDAGRRVHRICYGSEQDLALTAKDCVSWARNFIHQNRQTYASVLSISTRLNK